MEVAGSFSYVKIFRQHSKTRHLNQIVNHTRVRGCLYLEKVQYFCSNGLMTDTPSNIPGHDQSCYKQYSEANIVGTKACPSYEAFSLSVETVIEGCLLPELSICKEDFKELERKVNVALDVCWMLWNRINPIVVYGFSSEAQEVLSNMKNSVIQLTNCTNTPSPRDPSQRAT